MVVLSGMGHMHFPVPVAGLLYFFFVITIFSQNTQYSYLNAFLYILLFTFLKTGLSIEILDHFVFKIKPAF